MIVHYVRDIGDRGQQTTFLRLEQITDMTQIVDINGDLEYTLRVANVQHTVPEHWWEAIHKKWKATFSA